MLHRQWRLHAPSSVNHDTQTVEARPFMIPNSIDQSIRMHLNVLNLNSLHSSMVAEVPWISVIHAPSWQQLRGFSYRFSFEIQRNVFSA